MAIIITLTVLIILMRNQRKNSRTRFATYAIGSSVYIFVIVIASISYVKPIDIAIDAANYILGRENNKILPINNYINSLMMIVFGIIVVYFILRFAKHTISAWEGNTTQNDPMVRDPNTKHGLLTLAISDLTTTLRGTANGTVDPKSTKSILTAPKSPDPIEFKELVRTAFLNHIPEADIINTNWRQQTQSWIGIMHGPKAHEENDIILMIFEDHPTDTELTSRISTLAPNNNCKLFAIAKDNCHAKSERKEIKGHTIEIWSYNNLIREGLPLASYARQLIKQFNNMTVGGTATTLSESFVDSRIKNQAQVDYKLTFVVEKWLQEKTKKHLAITGEYGQGKSTAMLSLCVEWAKSYLNGDARDQRIPLLIELRGKSPGDSTPLEFIAQWCTRYHFNAENIYSLIKSGQALLIFEGFDELKNAGRQLDRHEHFNALWKFAYPNTKIIFTGRPNFFLDQSEKNTTLRIDKNSGAGMNAFTEVYSICMFAEEEVKLACRGYSQNVREGILRAFIEHEDFREIVARPSMLPVVATIWDEIISAESHGIDINGSMLLERYLSAIYARKEAEIIDDRIQHSQPMLGSYLLLPRAVREALTLAVVWSMAVADLKNTISRDKFNEIIDNAFDNILLSLQSSEVDIPTANACATLMSRLDSESRNDLIEKVCTDVATAGLFVEDPAAGISNLRFAHKQYFEFLIAKYTWLQLAMPKSTIIKSINLNKNLLSPKILGKTDALKPFNRLLDKNLKCFKRYRLQIKYHALLMLTPELLEAAMINSMSACYSLTLKLRSKTSQQTDKNTQKNILKAQKFQAKLNETINHVNEENYLVKLWFSLILLITFNTLLFLLFLPVKLFYGVEIHEIMPFTLFIAITLPITLIPSAYFYYHLRNIIPTNSPVYICMSIIKTRMSGEEIILPNNIKNILHKHKTKGEIIKLIYQPETDIPLQDIVQGAAIPTTLTKR